MKNWSQTFLIPLVSALTFFFVNITNFQEDALAKEKVSATTKTDWGLHTATFETPEGKIKVNLPDDMAAGDTISGTVIAEPAGTTLEEKERNSDELNGYVVEVEAEGTPVKKTSVSGKVITAVAIPTAIAGGVATLILKDSKGNSVAMTEVPVQPKPPAIETPSVPTSEDFQLPSIGQAGRPIEVSGPFDGDIDTTDVKVGGNDVEVLAESPRKVVAQSPRDVVGPTEIEVKEGDVVAKGEMNNLKVNLSADKRTLHRGEMTNLGVKVSGLQGIQNPVLLKLANETPEVVSIQGGDIQTISISPDEVTEEGIYITELPLTGIQPGFFDIYAQAQDQKCKHFVYEEREKWGKWYRDKDGTKWREGTLYRVKKCVDPGPPHELGEPEEIGKLRDEKKGSRASRTTQRKIEGGGTRVTREDKDSKGKVKRTTTAEYDNGNVTKVTKTDRKGKVTEEWEKKGDKWYKNGAERSSGPRNVPEKLGN